jgi:hypothetical protein
MLIGASPEKSRAPSNSANGAPWVRRITWALLILCSIGLLVSSIYRAATVPFTHDESLSFAIFSWDPRWRATANNHLLNTALMQWCSTLFGNSEISLRLPNLLAHGAYLLASLALVKRVQDAALQITGFVLFNLNLFLLDFFSLARGYGLALAFEMLSLYLLVRAYEENRPRGFQKHFYLSASAGALAVLSNFTFLNYYLPLLLAFAWLMLTDASLRQFSRSHIAATLAVLSANGVFLTLILSKIFALKRIGQLYLGGHVSFISDTVQSLVRCSLYSIVYSQATAKAIFAILVVLFLVLLLLGVCQLSFFRKGSAFGVLLMMLAAAVALPILQHHLFHTLFPVERAALYYLPLYAVVLLYGLHSLTRVESRRWKRFVILTLATATAVTLSWHFLHGFNVHTSYTWWQDSHNYDVLEIISRDREHNFPGRTVNLRTSWIVEPSLNFYRVTHHYTWLKRMTREPITRTDADYIYAFESELDTLLIDRDIRLASYPDIHTVVVRVNHGDEP